MREIIDSLAVLLGREPRKPWPEEYTQEAKDIHTAKRQVVKRFTKADLLKERERIRTSKGRHRWRNRRWTTIIIVNLLFVLSFHLDIQIAEGALTSSRFLGFHMSDVTGALEVMLAHKTMLINLVIGMCTVLFVWWLLGGANILLLGLPLPPCCRMGRVAALVAHKQEDRQRPRHSSRRTNDILCAVHLAGIYYWLFGLRDHQSGGNPQPCLDLRPESGAGLGCAAVVI